MQRNVSFVVSSLIAQILKKKKLSQKTSSNTIFNNTEQWSKLDENKKKIKYHKIRWGAR